MSAVTATLAPGFGDPVHDSQTAFRRILEAMARPGHIFDVSETHAAPAPVGPAMAAAMLTLLDADTPVWFDPVLAEHAAVADYVRFHCGCPLVAAPHDAAFAFAGDAAAMPRLEQFYIGDDQYPERSATVIAEIAALTGGPARILRGPGIRDTRDFDPVGLPDWFWNSWAINRGNFPLGVDLIFTCGNELAALPRSVTAEE